MKWLIPVKKLSKQNPNFVLFLIFIGIGTLLYVVAVSYVVTGDYSEWSIQAKLDSVAIYRQEVADLNAELTDALALQQCYHEELIRVVFECYPESVYTIPCNGRKVVVR